MSKDEKPMARSDFEKRDRDAPTTVGVCVEAIFVGALVLASLMIAVVDGLDRLF